MTPGPWITIADSRQDAHREKALRFLQSQLGVRACNVTDVTNRGAGIRITICP